MQLSPSTRDSRTAPRRLARVVGLLLIAAMALAAGGCGGKDVYAVEAKEGGRIFVDDLFYQVQLSRQLNTKDVEDSTYLQGQPQPATGDTYFGVFVRADNETSDRRILPIGIDAMKITTAGGDVFRPIPVKASGWGWAPAPLGKGAMLPIPNTPAHIGPIRGGLILFRIPLTDLDNRPLVLEIKGKGGHSGHITLDV